jgi:hypothetical protein
VLRVSVAALVLVAVDVGGRAYMKSFVMSAGGIYSSDAREDVIAITVSSMYYNRGCAGSSITIYVRVGSVFDLHAR